MTFPLLIEDEPHLCRLIRQIAKEVTKEQPKVKMAMNKQDCYDLASRAIVDRAIARGTLKIHILEGRGIIKRREFDEWFNKTR